MHGSLQIIADQTDAIQAASARTKLRKTLKPNSKNVVNDSITNVLKVHCKKKYDL